MPRYTVIDGHKKHDGREYAPGDIMECGEDTAKTLRLAPIAEEAEEISETEPADINKNKKGKNR